MKTKIKITLSITLALIIYAIALFTAPVMARAFQHLFGYLPGAGIVDQSIEPRQLAEPVSQTRDGVALTVESALLSADLTIIEVKVAGIPASAYPIKATPPGKRQMCSSPVFLRLPDGATLEMDIRSNQATLGSEFGAAESKNTWTLEPVPANIETATLVMPCILGLQPSAAPENWEVPLHFVPVEAHYAAPGVPSQLPVATPEPLTPTLAAPSVSTPTQSVTQSEVKKLTECDTFCDWPDWSPDGRYLAYNNGDQHALWVMEADGGNPHLLSSTQARFAWAPDGTQLAIISFGRLFAIRPDGSGLLALSDSASDWVPPAWSPDGKQIAFLAQGGNSLSIIVADGSHLQNLYNQPGGVSLDEFYWLPDSRQIVFTTQTCRGNPMKCLNGFKLIDSDGNGLRSLYEGENMSLWFLSQDGKQVYILDSAREAPYRVNLDGSGTAQLATLPPAESQTISPDGTQVIYLSSEGDLEIMKLDGTERRTLVKQVIIGIISWSPDGKRIAFVSTSQGEEFELYVINTDGSGLANVNAMNHPGYSDATPVWSPDGLHLAFISFPLSTDQDKSQIYIVDLPR